MGQQMKRPSKFGFDPNPAPKKDIEDYVIVFIPTYVIGATAISISLGVFMESFGIGLLVVAISAFVPAGFFGYKIFKELQKD